MGPDAGGLRLRLPGDEAGAGFVVGNAAARPAGSTVLVAIRPEHLRMAPAAEAPADTARATVSGHVFRGATHVFQLQRPGLDRPLMAYRQITGPVGETALPVGAEVALSWLPGTARLLEDEPRPEAPAAVGMRSLLCNLAQTVTIGAFCRALPDRTMPPPHLPAGVPYRERRGVAATAHNTPWFRSAPPSPPAARGMIPSIPAFPTRRSRVGTEPRKQRVVVDVNVPSAGAWPLGRVPFPILIFLGIMLAGGFVRLAGGPKPSPGSAMPTHGLMGLLAGLFGKRQRAANPPDHGSDETKNQSAPTGERETTSISSRPSRNR